MRIKKADPGRQADADAARQRLLRDHTWDVRLQQMFDLAEFWVLDQGLARQGDRVIVTAGVPVGIPGTTNLVKVIEIK